MVSLIIKHASRSLTALMVAVAIMGLATAKAGIDNCDPGCIMHQPAHEQAACCNVDESDHLQMVTSSSTDQSRSQLPCCDRKLCVDPSFETRETAFMTNTIENADVGSQLIYYSAVSPNPGCNQPISQKCFPQKTIPVYVITCVYLI